MKIQLKRSDQLQSASTAKEPSISQLEFGELAVNYNSKDPTIFIKVKKDEGGEELVRIASGNAIGGYPDLDDGNGVDLDNRYVKKGGDKMRGHLELFGGGGDKDALQKLEILDLINSSDTGAGVYVLLNGPENAAQIITGLGLAAQYYYASDGFVFIEGDANDSGMFWKADNIIEFKTEDETRLEIGENISLYTDLYDKDGLLISGGVDLTAEILCPDSTAVYPEETLQAKGYVLTEGRGGYIVPPGWDVKYNEKIGQWGRQGSTVFVNNGGDDSNTIGGFYFTGRDPVSSTGTSNDLYFATAAHIQESGNVISDGFTVGLTNIKQIDQGKQPWMTGIYPGFPGSNFEGDSLAIKVRNEEVMKATQAQVKFNRYVVFEAGSNAFNLADNQELREALESRDALIEALTARVAALENNSN